MVIVGMGGWENDLSVTDFVGDSSPERGAWAAAGKSEIAGHTFL